MLLIRDSQMDAFVVPVKTAWLQHVAGAIDLAGSMFEDCDRLELRSLLEDELARSRTWGIISPDEQNLFLRISIDHGLRLGETPETAWAREILLDPAVSGIDKLTAIIEAEEKLIAKEQH